MRGNVVPLLHRQFHYRRPGEIPNDVETRDVTLEVGAQHRPPLCECGGFLKPATISFGQSLEPNELERARLAALQADLVVALGSTLSVYPASAYPLMAAQRDVPYVIVNRGATEHDGEAYVSLRLEGEVSEIFPAAVAAALK